MYLDVISIILQLKSLKSNFHTKLKVYLFYLPHVLQMCCIFFHSQPEALLLFSELVCILYGRKP